MKHPVEFTEQIPGNYEHVPAILRLDLDRIIREPLHELRAPVGRSSLVRPVNAQLGPMQATGQSRGRAPGILEIPLRWSAAEHPALFPTMKGRLSIADAGNDTIEVRLIGEYTPPLGAVGAFADRLAGHQAVITSLRGYLCEVSRRLQGAITKHTPVVPAHGHPGMIERSP